jgi:hypothetical protein
MPFGPQSRNRRVAVALVAVVIVVIAAVYVWQANRTTAPSKPAAARKTSAPSRPSVPTVSQLPAQATALVRACHGKGAAFSAAPAYAGSGPHPIAVFLSGAPADSVPSALPEPASQWLPGSPAKVQLVGCVQLSSKGPKSGLTCVYNLIGTGAPVPVFNGRYTITIYDLREHRKIVSMTVTGVDHSCPKKIPVIDTIFSRLTATQLDKLLDPYVSRAS